MTVSLGEKAINNNDVLRRVRYIFDFNDQTMADIFALGGCKANQTEVAAWLARDDDKSKHELSALFRRPDHKNYRECLDQVLRNVLDGMAKHYKQS